MQKHVGAIFTRFYRSHTSLLKGVSLLLLMISLVMLILPLPKARAATGITTLSFPGQQLWVQNGVPTSSYIFGTTDLAQELVTPNIETSTDIQTVLKNSGITLLRTEFPDNASDKTIDQRLKAVANTGATCLGTILNPNNTTWDTHLVQYAGDRCTLWEIGNTPDLTGISVQTYLQDWNKLVPQLRQANKNSMLKVLGPGISTENHDFLDTFLKGARQEKMLPDGISYHWFPCMQLNQDKCMAQDTSVSKTVQDAQALSQQDLGDTLPIAITAWNAQASTNPSAYISDRNFITKFTIDALTTMIQSGVAIAAQVAAASGDGGGQLDMISTKPIEAKAQLTAMQVLIDVDKANCATGTATSLPTSTANATATATNAGCVLCPTTPTTATSSATNVTVPSGLITTNDATASTTSLTATVTPNVSCLANPCPTASVSPVPGPEIACPTSSPGAIGMSSDRGLAHSNGITVGASFTTFDWEDLSKA